MRVLVDDGAHVRGDPVQFEPERRELLVLDGAALRHAAQLRRPLGRGLVVRVDRLLAQKLDQALDLFEPLRLERELLEVQRRAELRAELAEPLVEEAEAPRVERAGAELRERALLRELLEKLGRLVERLADGRHRPSDGLDLSRRQALRRFDDVLELLGDLRSAPLQHGRGFLVEAHLAHREAELG